MANKIKYGLSSVYYALATIANDQTATYETPVAWPGAVSLSLDPEGENTPFYADDVVYWVGAGNNGYSGDLEMARVIDSFKTDVLGYIEDDNGVLIEDADAEAKHFALLFQFKGDVKNTRHVLYNCTATRPSVSGETKGESVEPQTETSTITATTIYNAALDKNIAKAETTPNSDDTAYRGWFSNVYVPTVTASA